MPSLGPIELLFIVVFVVVAGLVVLGVVTTAVLAVRNTEQEHAAARSRALGG